MTELTKTKVEPHIGHALAFTSDITLTCETCGEVLWSQAAVSAKANRNQKARFARMKVEDPNAYRKINREKSAARRARLKEDPVKYAEYLAKAKAYNDRAITKRKAASA